MDAHELERLIERLCDDYLRQLIEGDRAERRVWASDDDTREAIDLGVGDAIEWESERLDRGKTDHVRDDALALLANAGQTLEGDSLDALLWELVRTRLVAFKRIREEREGDAVGRPRVPLHTAPPVAHIEPPAKPSPMLSEVISKYIEDHEGKTWAPRTALMIKSALAEFLRNAGDAPVRSISKDQIRGYRLALDKAPGRAAGLSAATIRKRMSYLISLFRYAQRMEWIERNPADGLRPPKGKQVHRERDEFTDEELRTIFGNDYRAATLGKGDHARYWIPLVLLFTGARLEEIAQLEIADVVEIEGTPCIKITARSTATTGKGEAKTLKTVGSDRTVPLHSGLVALGFLDYVEIGRTAGHVRVFPKLQRGPNRGFGGPVSKWFTRWKRAHGITSRTKVPQLPAHVRNAPKGGRRAGPHDFRAARPRGGINHGWQVREAALGGEAARGGGEAGRGRGTQESLG